LIFLVSGCTGTEEDGSREKADERQWNSQKEAERETSSWEYGTWEKINFTEIADGEVCKGERGVFADWEEAQQAAEAGRGGFNKLERDDAESSVIFYVYSILEG